MRFQRFGRLAAITAAGALALSACAGNDPVETGDDTGNGASGGNGGAEETLSGEISAGGASSQEAAM